MCSSYRKEREETRRKILTFLKGINTPTHDTEIARVTDLNLDSVYHCLNRLAVEGMVKRTSKQFGKLTIFLWEITDKGKEWLKQT